MFVNTDVTLSHAVSGGDYDSVSADDVEATILAISDNRRIIQVGVTATTQNLAVPEGGSETYLMVLSQLPTGDVSVSITVEDTANNDVTTDETSLTFTTANWNQTRTVTVRAAQDDDAVQDPAVIISHAASGAIKSPGQRPRRDGDHHRGRRRRSRRLRDLPDHPGGEHRQIHGGPGPAEPAGNVTVTISRSRRDGHHPLRRDTDQQPVDLHRPSTGA